MGSRVYYHADGVKRTALFDSEKPFSFATKTEVDVTELIETNKRLAESLQPRSTNRLLARVPMTVYETSVHEGWDEGDWQRWLNNPDNKVFRVWQGRV